jgi:hypothetical protein
MLIAPLSTPIRRAGVERIGHAAALLWSADADPRKLLRDSLRFTGVAGARRTARKHPVVDPSVAARAHDELRRARRADPLLRPNAAIKHLEHWFNGQGLPCPSETTLRRQIIWKVFGKSRRKRATTDPNEI